MVWDYKGINYKSGNIVMKYVLFMHVGSANHGCEAIIRTTSDILGGPKDLILWSQNKEEDEQYGSSACFEKVVVSEQIDRFSPSYFEALFQRKILRNSRANLNVFLRDQFKGNIGFSIGGDNYCYPWSAKLAVGLDEVIRRHAAKTILWACSIDEKSITREVREDLEKFDLITAREQLSYDLLRRINPNTIKVADPAFLLEKEDLPLPEGFIEGNTVGINISPLINDYALNKNIILDNYKELIRFIINETDMNICLIPHVVWPYNNDCIPIQLLYNEFKETGRITYIEDGNCMQLKGYISRCRFFVGARTHATIAAYSSYVPTLAVGYSVKSIGIARDLFETDVGYVIPVQGLMSLNELKNQFIILIESERKQKNRLKSIIPEYKAEALKAKTLVESMK